MTLVEAVTISANEQRRPLEISRQRGLHLKRDDFTREAKKWSRTIG